MQIYRPHLNDLIWFNNTKDYIFVRYEIRALSSVYDVCNELETMLPKAFSKVFLIILPVENGNSPCGELLI